MSLLTPDFGLLFWMLLCFFGVFFILAKFGWPVIIGMINKRGEYIEDSLKAADEANERLKNIQVAGEKILTEAKNEQVNILREATNIKEQVIADAKNLAQIEADKLMANAHASIEQERKNAISDIRSQVTELSISVAEKILRKELTDRKADIELIDKLLNEVDIYKL